MNPRQERFVAEYLLDFNATQAAIRSGYAPRSAHVHACRLLTNANVAAAVEAGRKAIAEAAIASRDEVLQELTKVARATPEYTGTDKVRALERLGRYHGMWDEGGSPNQPTIAIQIVLGAGDTNL